MNNLDARLRGDSNLDWQYFKDCFLLEHSKLVHLRCAFFLHSGCLLELRVIPCLQVPAEVVYKYHLLTLHDASSSQGSFCFGKEKLINDSWRDKSQAKGFLDE